MMNIPWQQYNTRVHNKYYRMEPKNALTEANDRQPINISNYVDMWSFREFLKLFLTVFSFSTFYLTQPLFCYPLSAGIFSYVLRARQRVYVTLWLTRTYDTLNNTNR